MNASIRKPIQMKKVLVLNGINLNMFGKRDPKQYATTTLADIDNMLQTLARERASSPSVFRPTAKEKWSNASTKPFMTRSMP